MSRMLSNKKYYFMVEVTKSCQLSFSARWVYSFLVFRTVMNNPASVACIFRNCGLSNRAVKRYLSELREANLLAETNGHYLASDPGQHSEWFVRKGNADALPWFQRFATYAVYLPNPHQGIPLTHSALLSLVWSLKHGSGWKTIRPAALTTMLFPDMNRASAKRQVNRAVRNLCEKGLLDDHCDVTVQLEHHHLWRDADHLKNPRSRSDVGYANLREQVLDTFDGQSCLLFKNFHEMGGKLDRCEQVMKEAGYDQRQILEFWHDVIFEPTYGNGTTLVVEGFIAKGFMPVFKMAEEMTAQNRIAKGYVGISLGFLRQLTQFELLTIKDMAMRRNSNGECLLQYYEPSEERLRASGRLAG